MRRGNVREAVRMLRESVTILEDKSYTFAIRVRKRLAQALFCQAIRSRPGTN
jgi:hypothetical protein